MIKGLNTLLQTDYADIDETSARIEIETYDHYYHGSIMPAYTTNFIELTLGNSSFLSVGTQLATGEKDKATGTRNIDGVEINYDGLNRYNDEAGDKMTFTKHTRSIPTANLYDCINEVLNQYIELRDYIFSYVVTDESNSPTDGSAPATVKPSPDAEEASTQENDDIFADIRAKLDENHRIDDACGNLFSLYEGDSDLKKAVASLPRLVDLYVEQADEAEPQTPEPPASNKTDGKEKQTPDEKKLAQETAKLHEYLRRLKHVSHCLAPVEAIISPVEPENPTTTESAPDAALTPADDQGNTDAVKAAKPEDEDEDRDNILSKHESYANSLTKKTYYKKSIGKEVLLAKNGVSKKQTQIRGWRGDSLSERKH